VFVNLTAACDNVRSRAFIYKLLWLLPDRQVVPMIMKLVGNRSFTVTISNNERSRLRRRKIGIPQGSILPHLLFNIYTSDMPMTNDRLQKVCVRRPSIIIMHIDGD